MHRDGGGVGTVAIVCLLTRELNLFFQSGYNNKSNISISICLLCLISKIVPKSTGDERNSAKPPQLL